MFSRFWRLPNRRVPRRCGMRLGGRRKMCLHHPVTSLWIWASGNQRPHSLQMRQLLGTGHNQAVLSGNHSLLILPQDRSAGGGPLRQGKPWEQPGDATHDLGLPVLGSLFPVRGKTCFAQWQTLHPKPLTSLESGNGKATQHYSFWELQVSSILPCRGESCAASDTGLS